MSALLDEIAEALELIEGRPRLPDEVLGRFCDELEHRSPEDPQAAAAELVAYAFKFHEADAVASRGLVAQLSAITSVLLDDATAAALFQGAGLNSEVTGASESKVPVGAGDRPAGSSTPFDLLLGKK